MQLTLYPSQCQQNVYFSKLLSTSLSSLLSSSEFGTCLAKNNTALEQPLPRGQLKGLSEVMWTKCLEWNDVTETRAGCSVLLKMVRTESNFALLWV